MRKRWIGYLLTLFALLWAKLPGPSAQEEPDPSHEFRFKRKGTAGENVVEVSTEAARLPGFSERITGITTQEVKPRADGRGYIAAKEPLRSTVEVKMRSPRIAELHGLRQEVRERLLSSTGHHAIVMGSVEEERFDKQEETIAEGKGQGIWRILWRKK